jgi:prepilin-type N-terminal cleavage/methylation domain-containing protein
MNSSWGLPHRRRTAVGNGFTLVEMLVVVGIIGFLIALLMPALNKAQAQAQKTQCMSNEHEIGLAMMTYAEQYGGFLFPPNKGWPAQNKPSDPNTLPGFDPAPPLVDAPADAPPVNYGALPPSTQQFDVWMYYVFERKWNPPVMVCPSDPDPGGMHSYLVNAHLYALSMDNQKQNGDGVGNLRYSSPLPSGRSPSDVIVLGEKLSSVYDCYMDPGDFDTKVEQFRHGVQNSNVQIQLAGSTESVAAGSGGSNYLMLDMHVQTELPAVAVGGLDPWDPTGTVSQQTSGQ